MTELLDTIDDAIAGWEAQPEAWNPGDPLYDHPYLRGEGEGNCVRPMFQLVEDYPPYARCKPCDVVWSGPEPCWVCGEDRPMATLLAPGPWSAASGTWARLNESLREMSEVMARQLDARLAELVRTIQMPEQPLRVSVADLNRAADALRRPQQRPLREAVPASPPRGVVMFIPTVEDITAPTMAELALANGIDISQAIAQIDPTRQPAPEPPVLQLDLDHLDLGPRHQQPPYAWMAFSPDHRRRNR